MNFIFISPQFPRVYWNFCDRLKKKGVNVLGIGDTPYDQLAHEVRESLTEYYFVPSLADYDQMLRAVAFFTFKYGRITGSNPTTSIGLRATHVCAQTSTSARDGRRATWITSKTSPQ